MAGVPGARPFGADAAAMLLGLAGLLLCPNPSTAQPAQPSLAAQNAAMSELVRPEGVGGCVVLGVSSDVRREALVSLMAEEPGSSPALQTAVAQVAPRCTGRPYASSDLALVGAVTSTLRRGAAALALAQQYGVGQRSLDAAWRAADPSQKAAFYAVAEDFLKPAASVAPRAIDTSPFAARVHMPTAQDPRGERLLRMYLIGAALSERAEAQLAREGARPAPD